MSFPNKRRKFLLPACLLLLALSVLFCFIEQNLYFRKLCNDFVEASLENNPLELHYTIAYPSEMGFDDLEKNLIPFARDSYSQGALFWQSLLNRLDHVSDAFLKEDLAFSHTLLTRYVSLKLEELAFPYYDNPLSSVNGIHCQLPILLSEYTFRSLTDVEDYLNLLMQLPDYLEGVADYMQAKEEAGLSPFQGELLSIQNQCTALFPEEELKEQKHFLQTSFAGRLKELAETVPISEADQASYVELNSKLICELIAPAYRKLAASIGELEGAEKLSGLCAYPDGQAYYALLLKESTGSSRSVEEIRKMLYARYDALFEEFKSLLAQSSPVQSLHFPLEKPVDMVYQLIESSREQFPSLPEIEETDFKVTLKDVDSALAPMSAPAFYMTPPVDENLSHTIYVNPESSMEALDLYATLAHEGFPGHLYQTVFSQNALSGSSTALLRELLYYGGFTEGWAVYAEINSYDYARSLCEETAAASILAQRYNREIQLCLCSILDIYIHYDGADLSDVEALLKNLGLNGSAAPEIYETICASPANYPKYYVGYLEILNLKDAAKEQWKEDYSDLAFHAWLLKEGAADFQSLYERLLKTSAPS